jgi:hypothetical protein
MFEDGDFLGGRELKWQGQLVDFPRLDDAMLTETLKDEKFYQEQVLPFAQLIESKYINARNYKIFDVFVGGSIEKGEINEDFPEKDYSILNFLHLKKPQRMELINRLRGAVNTEKYEDKAA